MYNKNVLKYLPFLFIIALIIIIKIFNLQKNNNVQFLYENEIEKFDKESNSKIVDVVIGNTYKIELSEDGSVWFSNGGTGEKKKLHNLKKIIKIVDAGAAFYALSSDGDVFAWGSNKEYLISPKESKDKFFHTPVKYGGLSNISVLEARNGKAFAVDQNGKLFAWGLHIYWDPIDDYVPGFPENSRDQVADVEAVFIGAGNYHYFIRKNKTAFSIMESEFDNSHVNGYLFPDLSHSETALFVSSIEKILNSVTLNCGSKVGSTILYELGETENIELISADDYTMFVYDKDNSLFYWNSERVKYHDNKKALVDKNKAEENASGKFEKIDIKQILGVDNSSDVEMIDICSAKENSMFLTDTGLVFISEYTTYDTRDVEYYNIANTNPSRTVFTSVIPNMKLKKITFRQLDLENIIRINTDGKKNFTAVNTNGEYYLITIDPTT